MAEVINGVPIGDLPGIESVPDDSMLVVEFLGKAYHMPGAVLRQMIQDVLDSMGDSVDDVTEARLTAAIETVLLSGKYNGVSPSVEVLDEEDGTTVIHIIDAFGDKRYPVEVKGARNAVQYVEQELTDEQKAQARKNIGVGDGAGTADAVQYVPQTLTAEQQTQARNNIGISTHVSDLWVIVNPNYDLTSQHVMMDWGYVFEDGTKIDSRFEFDVPYSAYELARRNGYTKDELTFYKEMSSNLGNPKADSLQIDSDTGTLMLLSAGEPIGAGVQLPTGSADDSKIFIADLNTSTLEDIKAANDAGKICYALFGGYTACILTTLTDSSAVFTSNLDPHLGVYVKFVAGITGVSDFGLMESHSVLYEPQSLTDAQKAQARKNIGALSADDIDVDSIGSNVFVGKYDTVTYAEIKAAHDAGKVCFLDFNGISLPLLGVNDTEAMFVREINENTDYRVTITSAGGKDFTIVDKNISDVYVTGLFSATYAAVKAAYEAGKACFVTYGALLCPLTVLDEEKAEFVGMLTPNMGIKGIVPAEGTIDWTYVRSNAVQTVSQSLSDDQKAQARTNIGAAAAADLSNYLPKSGNANTATIPLGFSSRQTNGNWGNTDGTTVTCWLDSTGGGIDFRRDNPSSGKLSIKLDGRVYVNEGKTPVMGTEHANGFWGITSPDGENNVWIRTTTQGIIPYQNGGAGSGHCNLGTSSWYFANAYIDKIYGSNFSGLAAKATADANGNDIASTYANKTVANTFNGEQKMVNSTHCPTMNDIAAGVGCSLKNARACDNQLIVAEIFAPTATVTDSKINMSSVAGEIGFYHGGSGSGGQFTGKTQLARITSAGIYEGSTLLSDKYLAKSGGTLTGMLKVGSAAIQTNGYVISTWLQTTANIASSNKIDKVCVLGSGGWIYTRTLDQLRNDMNAAAAPLRVNYDTATQTVDKTLSEIKAAWDAGRSVVLTDGTSVYPLSYVDTSEAVFSGFAINANSKFFFDSVHINSSGKVRYYSYSN